MKKNFLKKLASVLSLALVVSTITPAASASAAAAPNLAKRYTNVYEGNGYAYTVKNAKGHTVKWTVSGAGAEYVNLSKKTGASTKLTIDTEGEAAAKNKNVTVKANFYKGGKLVKAAGDVIKVKVSATGLGIVTADADVDLNAIGAGEVVDFNRTITPKNATSVTYWSVTDKDGNATTDATIDGTGNFKADKVGEYVVKAVARNAKNGKDIVVAEKAVKVVYAVKSAKQTTAYKVDVTFGADVSKVVTKDNLIITNANGVKQIIKGVSFSADGKLATVELYVPFSDKVTYTVAYTDSKVDFIASKGDPVSIVVTPKTVQYGVASKFDVALYDANGVDVSVDSLLDQNVSFEYDNTLAYIDYNTADKKHEITVFNYDKTVSVKATYHTWKYENNAEVKYESAPAVFTSVKEIKNSATDLAYTVTTGDPDWDKVNSSITAKKSYNFFVKGVNQNGDKINQSNGDFESTDTNVLTVYKDNLNKVTVYGVATGTAYVKFTYGDTVRLFPVTVSKESEATTLELDNKNITLYSSVHGDIDHAVVITATVKDQLGNEMDYDNDGETMTFARKSGDSRFVVQTTPDGNKIKLSLNGAVSASNDGTSTHEVEYYGKKAYFTVNVVEVTDTTAKYIGLDTNNVNVDVAFDTTTAEDNDVTIRAYEYNAKGQIVRPSTSTTFEVKYNNKTVPNSDTDATYTVTAGKLVFHASDADTTLSKQAAAGTYTVKVTALGTEASAYIIVKNTQSLVKVERKETNVNAASASAVAVEGLKFTVNGDEVKAPVDFTIVKVTGNINTAKLDGNDSVSTDDVVYIESVTIERTIGGAKVQQKVNVNMSFKVK